MLWQDVAVCYTGLYSPSAYYPVRLNTQVGTKGQAWKLQLTSLSTQHNSLTHMKTHVCELSHKRADAWADTHMCWYIFRNLTAPHTHTDIVMPLTWYCSLKYNVPSENTSWTWSWQEVFFVQNAVEISKISSNKLQQLIFCKKHIPLLHIKHIFRIKHLLLYLINYLNLPHAPDFLSRSCLSCPVCSGTG